MIFIAHTVKGDLTMKANSCPICGAAPATFFQIGETDYLKRGINTFFLYCRMYCPDCGHIDVRRCGEYHIAPNGSILIAYNAVDAATSAYNHAVEEISERIRHTWGLNDAEEN